MRASSADFQFRLVPELPGLAWGASFSSGTEPPVVWHGYRVEVLESGFIEGAWNGDFEDFPPSSATVVCGTGGASQDSGYVFWAGTDNIFPLYSIRKADTLFISNSAVFCMILAGEEPDPFYPFYYDDFIRIIRLGFNREGRLRTASGCSLCLHFGHIVSVSHELKRSYSRFPAGSAPVDYESYYRLLAGSVDSVLRNAESCKRSFPYYPVTACSSGYDTNAAAVLAARAGCENAISFNTPIPEGGNRDSGAHIADVLGLRISVKNNNGFKDLTDLMEFSVVPHAMSCPYAVFEKELEGGILVSGHNGDSVWGPRRAAVFTDNRASWARFHSGYGLAEYRLRVGLLVLPVPRIGSVHNAAIYRIAQSDDMSPWRIGGAYDRPIPRRIVEEAGVPRNEFGMKKMGGAHIHMTDSAMQNSAMMVDYRRFMAHRKEQGRQIVGVYWRLRHGLRRFLLRRLTRKRKRFVAYTPWVRMFSFLVNRPILFDWYHVFWFRYSFEALKERYKVVREGNSRMM